MIKKIETFFVAHHNVTAQLRLWSFLFVFALFVTQGVVHAQPPSSTKNPASTNAVEQVKAEAATLLEQKEFEAAYQLYSRLLREEPEDEVINLGFARTALLTGRHSHAILTYERLLTKYENDPSLLRELAYVLHKQNDEQGSKRTLSSDKDLSAEEVDNIIANWRKQQDRFQMVGLVRGGLMYDSNINGGPPSNTISLGAWDNVILHNGKAVESAAAYLGTQIDMGYRLSESSPWWLVGDVKAFARYNFNDRADDIDLSSSEWASTSVGFRHIGAKHLFDVRVKAEMLDYEFDQNVIGFGPDVSFIYAATPSVHLITEVNIDRRVYSDNTGYNGWYPSVGQYVRYFFGEKRHNVVIGGRYLNGSAKEDNYSFDALEASLAFTFMLPYSMELSPYISYMKEDYDGPATGLETDNREDERLRVGVSFDIPINDMWKVETSYMYTNNHSNSELYDYDQHVVMMGIAYSF